MKPGGYVIDAIADGITKNIGKKDEPIIANGARSIPIGGLPIIVVGETKIKNISEIITRNMVGGIA